LVIKLVGKTSHIERWAPPRRGGLICKMHTQGNHEKRFFDYHLTFSKLD
jgi:hypothetical protein